MPAIVTDALRRQIAQDFFDQFTNDTRKYYIGVGRSEQWDSSDTVPTPTNTPTTVEAFRNSLQAVKKVEATSLVVPRNNWSSGRIYSQYDDQQGGYPTQPYYIMNESRQVYVCLETGRDATGAAAPSTVQPTHANLDSRREADGYVWKFLFTISAERANNFLSGNFMPTLLQDATDSNSTGIQLKQRAVQDAATAGEVLSIIITDGGAGYTSVPTATLTDPSGANASFNITIDSATGQVVRIRMDDSTNGDVAGHGSGYTNPAITFNGGGATRNASARAVLGPDSGIGRDPREDLKSASVMFHADLKGTDSDFIVDQDFRQVGLIRDIKKNDNTIFDETTGNALFSMKLSSIITEFTADKIIEGQTTLARAYIDEVDSDILYYHQTIETGFVAFQTGELIEETNGGGEGVIDSAAILPEVLPSTGEVLFIDNRSPVDRSTAQNEDIKVIIQF
jgi:hypothetical protein